MAVKFLVRLQTVPSVLRFLFREVVVKCDVIYDARKRYGQLLFNAKCNFNAIYDGKSLSCVSFNPFYHRTKLAHIIMLAVPVYKAPNNLAPPYLPARCHHWAPSASIIRQFQVHCRWYSSCLGSGIRCCLTTPLEQSSYTYLST